MLKNYEWEYSSNKNMQVWGSMNLKCSTFLILKNKRPTQYSSHKQSHKKIYTGIMYGVY